MPIFCLFFTAVDNNKSFNLLKDKYLLLSTTRAGGHCVSDGLGKVKRTEYVVFLGVKRTEYVVFLGVKRTEYVVSYSANGPSMSYF